MCPALGAIGQPATTAGEIMSAPVITVSTDVPVGEVAEVLRANQISAVPVVGPTGALAGLVSEFDLLARPGGTAAEVMTTDVISVSPDTAISDVRHLLVERRIHRVPVVLRGEIVGIAAGGTSSRCSPPVGVPD